MIPAMNKDNLPPISAGEMPRILSNLYQMLRLNHIVKPRPKAITSVLALRRIHSMVNGTTLFATDRNVTGN